MSNENIYRTSDQHFAAYLIYRGYFCVSAIPSGTKNRYDFLFTDVETPKELEESFYRDRPETLVARTLLEKTRTTRHILRNALDEEALDQLKRGK